MTDEKKKYKKTSYSFKSEEQLLNFGTYNGRPIGEIMKKHPDYIDWCVKEFKGFKLWKSLDKRFKEIKEENNGITETTV